MYALGWEMSFSYLVPGCWVVESEILGQVLFLYFESPFHHLQQRELPKTTRMAGRAAKVHPHRSEWEGEPFPPCNLVLPSQVVLPPGCKMPHPLQQALHFS